MLDSLTPQLLEPEGDALDALLLLEAPAGMVVTLSGGGTTLRGWAAGDGALLWEQTVDGGYVDQKDNTDES